MPSVFNSLIIFSLIIAVYSKVDDVNHRDLHKFFTENKDEQKLKWEGFKSQHSKKYTSEHEESDRFAVYLENLKLADERNIAEGAIVHGENLFSDISASEFKAKWLTTTPKPLQSADSNESRLEANSKLIPAPMTVENVRDDQRSDATATSTRASLRSSVQLESPANSSKWVDWSTGPTIYVTPVKTQGNCGNCYINDAIMQIESDAIRLLAQTFILSRQQITDCGDIGGCGGGRYVDAVEYVQRVGGLMLESEYPYVSGSTNEVYTCNFDSSKVKVTVDNYTVIGGFLSNEVSIAAYVQSVGPALVAIDASSLQSYTGGVLKVCDNSNEVNHVMQAVGVLPNSLGGYWKMRNTWGILWGESGYIRFAFGYNLCNAFKHGGFVTSVSLVEAGVRKAAARKPTSAPTSAPLGWEFMDGRPLHTCTSGAGNYSPRDSDACYGCPVGYACPDDSGLAYPCPAATQVGTTFCPTYSVAPSAKPTVSPKPSVSLKPSVSMAPTLTPSLGNCDQTVCCKCLIGGVRQCCPGVYCNNLTCYYCPAGYYCQDGNTAYSCPYFKDDFGIAKRECIQPTAAPNNAPSQKPTRLMKKIQVSSKTAKI